MRNLGFIIPFLVISLNLSAQVSNNSIQHRLELKLNAESIHSTTANSTVEWSCINKALTKKCLVYHNDQWFQFIPPAKGKYFLNLSSQQCRDLQGVQVIVIEGNPCETDSYKILRCIPKIFQDDVFIELDSLKANTLYLVNVDGFLGDFCEFDIQLSSKPAGFPEQNSSLDTLHLQAETGEREVFLKWHVHQSVVENISHFEVHRIKTGEIKSTLVSMVSAKSNTLGVFEEDYSVSDTLLVDGVYQYKIIGTVRDSENRLLLDRVSIHFKAATKQIVAKVPFSFGTKGRVEVFVISEKDNELLDYTVHDFEIPESLPIDITKFFDYGVKHFWIKLRHTKSKELKQYIYTVNENGEVVLVDE